MTNRNIFKKAKNILKNEHLLLILILFLGFCVRLYRIDNPIADWHSWRQADTASVSRIFIDDGIDMLHPRYYDISTAQSGMFNPQGWRMVEFPIFNLLHTTMVNLLPIQFVVAGRLVSILAALMTAYFLFKIAKEISGKNVGMLAAFFYLFIPYNIYFTRVILPEPLAVFFAIGSVWFTIKFLKSESFSLLYLASVFFAIALLVKPFTVFFAIPIFLLILDKYELESILKDKRFYYAALIEIIPLILWRMWIRQYPEGIPFWRWAFNEDGIRFRPAFWRWIFGERLGNLILGIWGLIPFISGVLTAAKKNKYVNYLLFGALMFVIVVATANVKHDYYQTYIIPAVSLALASGSMYLWNNKIFNEYLSRGILIFSLFIMFGIGLYKVKDFYNINHYEIIEAGKAVQNLTAPDDLVIAPYNGDTAFLYHTNRFGWPVVDRSIPELIQRGADYYVSVNFDSRTNELMKDHQIIKRTDKYVIIKLS